MEKEAKAKAENDARVAAAKLLEAEGWKNLETTNVCYGLIKFDQVECCDALFDSWGAGLSNPTIRKMNKLKDKCKMYKAEDRVVRGDCGTLKKDSEEFNKCLDEWEEENWVACEGHEDIFVERSLINPETTWPQTYSISMAYGVYDPKDC